MAENQSSLGGHLRENGMLLALVAIVALFSVLVSMQGKPMFLQAPNITNIFLQNGHVIILALGMLLIIVAGHIDLSVGSVLGVVGMVMGVTQTEFLPRLMGYDSPFIWILALGAGVAVGAAIGLLHGVIIAYLGVPAFIAFVLVFWLMVAKPQF